ncbi:glycosyl hydrolase [Sciscionella sediminilitoris]|uniref:glycosyl hydrolase n=1 Tax=Sciscionella sediminilitoris TaxID=1445613 RepID=UPI0004DEE2F4|nr:glycosyl hydrolase [Sciscionella sp. SE31]
MRARGINYDTGTFPGDRLTRKTLDPAQVQREMAVIAEELHCAVVRVSGRDPERLDLAARCAAASGLEVWFSPFPVDLHPDRIVSLFADCAQRAEALRREGARVVLVVGCELSAFAHGFLPGKTHLDRLHAMATADLDWWTTLGPVPERLNAFLVRAAATVRARFGGQVTYASGFWESVDWTAFDLVAVDAYRDRHNASTFRASLREYLAHGKPVAVTEYGTCAYQGAGELGGMAWQPPQTAIPDEEEQVRYFTELLDIFEEEGVDTALWFSFANYDKPRDRDIASYGVVRMLDHVRWEPKTVFHAMRSSYRQSPGRRA